MGASISGAVDKLIHEAALENELLTIAQGITTDHDDTFSMEFLSPRPNYFNEYLKGKSQAQDFIKKLNVNYDDHLERYLPDQTVNQSRSYADSNGWTAARAISTTDSIESSASSEVGSEGGKVGGGVTAGHSVTYSYESTLSHTSETTWTAQDYEIIPKPYTDGARDDGDDGDRSARRYARWVLDVATPTFAASNPNMALGDWQISTAARSSVTSNTEAIFWVGLNEADTVKLYGATDWEEGISVFELGVGHGHTSVYHEGKHVELNFTRPIHTALINATNEGSRDKVFIPFTQSGGRYINDK